MKIDYQEIEGIPEEITLKKIIEFYQIIFAVPDIQKFLNRINSAEMLLTVLAVADGKIVGLKIGYRLNSAKFYSWVGGVKPDFRKQGIGRELMKRQHDWCRKNGFRNIQTKTKNTFKEMLILNIKTGFDIIEVYRDKNDEAKIVLEKDLNLI